VDETENRNALLSPSGKCGESYRHTDNSLPALFQMPEYQPEAFSHWIVAYCHLTYFYLHSIHIFLTQKPIYIKHKSLARFCQREKPPQQSRFVCFWHLPKINIPTVRPEFVEGC
jgi:hypothetical protein